jgi:hypothetical protein
MAGDVAEMLVVVLISGAGFAGNELAFVSNDPRGPDASR